MRVASKLIHRHRRPRNGARGRTTFRKCRLADFICAARIDREADYSVASGNIQCSSEIAGHGMALAIEATLDMLNAASRRGFSLIA